ncbi:MAG: quinolinate synthase NadA, partial [Anaerolineae bacterium]|nr:quinolinate synthase NadA [Anaerolineae bacterium]
MTPEQIYEDLNRKIGAYTPEPELWIKARLAAEINQLKKERNAILLGHNYMEPALFHTVPDVVGDSLYLSRMAAETDKDIIVFCGVRFMAETAKILNPEKTVLIPALPAGCSLAAGITAEDVRQIKAQFPGVPVVTYINTYADVKAESDICCTSGNAQAVVESLGTDTVIFLPDEYLAANVAQQTGKHIIFPAKNNQRLKNKGSESSIFTPQSFQYDTTLDYQMVGWTARCEVHEKFTVEDITAIRADHPDVAILAHPECSPEVVAASDYSGSTTELIRIVERLDAPEYLLLTECSMGDNIAAANPEKNMLRLCSVRCPHMNQIQLEDTRDALKYTQFVTEVPEEIRLRAYQAVERMLHI